MSTSPRLYGYWRSSATWRVRWAFALKELPYEYVPVNILKGETQAPAHLARHPLGMLPVLETAPGAMLVESLAMLEWLDERYPETYALYPGCADDRATVRALCEIINSGTAPLQTPRAQKHHSDDPEKRAEWGTHFTREGLRTFDRLRENVLARPFHDEKIDVESAPFSLGARVTAADLCLVPQIYNALRFKIDVANEFPRLWRIYENSLRTRACSDASPERQSDAPAT